MLLIGFCTFSFSDTQLVFFLSGFNLLGPVSSAALRVGLPQGPWVAAPLTGAKHSLSFRLLLW